MRRKYASRKVSEMQHCICRRANGAHDSAGVELRKNQKTEEVRRIQVGRKESNNRPSDGRKAKRRAAQALDVRSRKSFNHSAADQALRDTDADRTRDGLHNWPCHYSRHDVDRMIMKWTKLTDQLPCGSEHTRVLIFTEGYDFNGEQFFDVETSSLNENSCIEGTQPEACRKASHWSPLPDPGSPDVSDFDEQPDGDPHGECAAEIARLTPC